METREVKFDMPKKDWGDGPWQSEPDREEWRDPVTGLPCLALRNHMGNWCGYVGVATTHPAYGLSYDGVPDEEFQRRSRDFRKRSKIAMKLTENGADFGEAFTKAWEGAQDSEEPVGVGKDVRDIQIHGGLTYAAACDGHICHTPEPGEPDNVWWFGFDAAHCYDFVPAMAALRRPGGPLAGVMKKEYLDDALSREVYRDLPYIKSECASLASQLHAMTKLLPAPDAPQ